MGQLAFYNALNAKDVCEVVSNNTEYSMEVFDHCNYVANLIRAQNELRKDNRRDHTRSNQSILYDEEGNSNKKMITIELLTPEEIKAKKQEKERENNQKNKQPPQQKNKPKHKENDSSNNNTPNVLVRLINHILLNIEQSTRTIVSTS